MILIDDIDNAFEYYDLDDKYRVRCYKCASSINSNKLFLDTFNKMYNLLNNEDFSKIKELWKYKEVNELFPNHIDPFVTNLMILLSYKTSQANIIKYKLDQEQIVINKNRIKECFVNDLERRNYGSVRISQMLWAYYFVRVKLIEVGRLQYELLETTNDKSIIKIHIPGGNKLDFDKVMDSIELSKEKLKEVFHINNIVFKCNSWLLSNQLNKLIDKNTNIYKFYSLFDVLDGEECTHDLLNFVFNIKECNNYNELPEETSLQKIIKNELINGTVFNIGIGALKGVDPNE